MSVKSRLLLASILATVWSTAAFAQAADPAAGQGNDEGLSDIIVTATRQATNLQNTPIAITAVTADQLKARQITSTADLGAVVPNATFRQAQGAYGRGLTAFIRGIGQADGSLASEPGVAFYVDDTYYPLVLGSLFDLLDLDHVEVLRGPQGTLFGRNALAGAVNLVAQEPSQTPSGYVELTTGRYNRLDLRGGFNVPITDTIALRVSGVSKRRDGYQKRLDFRCEMIRQGTPQLAGNFPYADGTLIAPASNDKNSCVVGTNGGEDVYAGRAALRWNPAPNVKIIVEGDYTKDTSSVQADSLIAVDTTTAKSNSNLNAVTNLYNIAFDSRFLTGDPYTTYATYSDPVQAGAVVPGSTFYNGSPTRGGSNNNPVNPVTDWGVSGKLVYGITDDIDATLILGYRNVETRYVFDSDGTPINLQITKNTTTHNQHTAEFRLTGKKDWIDWTAGLFYYRAHELVRQFTDFPYSNLQRYQNNRYEPESKSAYANVTIKPFNKLGIVLGGRYSDDKKSVSYDNRQDGNPSGDIVFDIGLASKRFDYKAGINYQANKNFLIYTSVATGFRLPSFNARPLQASQVQQIPGDNLIAYELGAKTDLFNHRLRINAAAFYTKYLQRAASVSGQEYLLDANGKPQSGGSVTIANPAGGAGATSCRALTAAEIAAGTPGYLCVGRTYYVNTPGVAKGFELDIEARPLDGLSLNATAGYSKFSSPDLDKLTVNPGRVSGVPEWSASAGIQYEIGSTSLGGTITPRLDWLYTGDITNGTRTASLNQAAYSVVNGRITYHNERNNFSISVSATNLLNKFYYYNIFDSQALGFPTTNAQPARPREWALTVGKRF